MLIDSYDLWYKEEHGQIIHQLELLVLVETLNLNVLMMLVYHLLCCCNLCVVIDCFHSY